MGIPVKSNGNIWMKSGGGMWAVSAASSDLSDWTARSTASNVVWAQRFTSDTDVSKFIVHGATALSAIVPAYKYCDTADGILGDGCLVQLTPASDTNAGKGSWVRPFSPISGVDVNNAGVATISDFSQIQDDGVWGDSALGGYFAKTAGAKVIGTEFWLQYRAKISANRLNNNIPRGKNINISVNNIGTPHQEIVADYETAYGGWLSYYTNGGNAWNSSIYDPQRASASTNDQIQNQSPWSGTCIIGNEPGSVNNCWRPPLEEWFTVMFHVIPGDQYVTTTSPTDASNPKNQTIEIYVAQKGDTSWTLIYSKTDLQFEFETTQPFGYNCVQFVDFNGGPSQVSSPEEYWHKFDQIILFSGSTQPSVPLDSYGQPDTAPAWFTSAAELTWLAPASNKIGDASCLDPLQNTTNAGSTGGGQIRGYCGMGTDKTNAQLFFLAGGGHSDYYGNEAYAVNLKAATPKFLLRRQADPEEVGGAGNYTVWSTNRPASDHSGLTLVEAGGRWFKIGHGGTNNLGNASQGQWWEFLRRANDYDNLGTSGHATNTGGTTSCGAVWSPALSRLLVVHSGNGNPSIEQVQLSDLTVTATNTNGLPTGGGIMIGMDTTNNILLVKDDGATFAYYWINMTTGASGAWNSLTATGSSPPNIVNMDWHAPSGAFLMWNKSVGNIIKLTPTVSSGAYTALVGSTVSVSGTAPTLDAGSAMVYNRSAVVPDMGNGQGALVVYQWTTGLSVIKLPTGGV